MAIAFDPQKETPGLQNDARSQRLNKGVQFLKDLQQKSSHAKPTLFNASQDLSSAEIIKHILKNEPSYPEIGLRQFSEWYSSRTREAIVMYVDSLHLKLKVTIQTLFLTISYIDTILSTYEQKPLQLTVELIAACCFILAMKTNETDFYFSFNEDLFLSFDRKYTLKPEDLFNMEIQCIQKLNYELNILSAYEMMSILLDFNIVTREEIRKNKGVKRELDSLCQTIAHKASYKGCIMLKYSSVQIGFSIIYTARAIKGLDANALCSIYEKSFGYSIRDYAQCVNDISK